MKLKFDYEKLEYSLEGLQKLATRGSEWAKREIRLNGGADESGADAGEEPTIYPSL